MRATILLISYSLTLFLGSCGSDDWIPLFDGETLND